MIKKSKSHWTPSAETLVKKAETRFRKKVKMAEDRRKRLIARHARLADDIVKATTEVGIIKKLGVQLTPAEKQLKAKEEAKVARIIALHDKEHKSFADIGKALKISHAWAHAVYRAHKPGKQAPKKALKTKPAPKKQKRAASKKSKPAVKAKAVAPSAKKVEASSPKKKTETPAIAEGATWGAKV